MPDYLTFVPNGEPTLDIHLKESIRLLMQSGIPIAVDHQCITTGDAAVRDALSTDWVSVKVDANDEVVWKKINRPHPKLTFEGYKGVSDFCLILQGNPATETLMVDGVNDGAELQHNAH